MYKNTHINYDNESKFNELASILNDFEDSSWKNDTCPSLHKWINEDEDHYIQVFVDYANPEMREDESLSEFFVVVNTDDREVFSLNSISEVISVVNFVGIRSITGA